MVCYIACITGWWGGGRGRRRVRFQGAFIIEAISRTKVCYQEFVLEMFQCVDSRFPIRLVPRNYERNCGYCGSS